MNKLASEGQVVSYPFMKYSRGRNVLRM